MAYLVRAFLISLMVVGLSGAQKKPEVRVTPDHVKSGDPILMTGSGFSPNRTVMSHLLRPNGSEYNPLRFRTDEHGEFVHKIDTVMLDLGTFESWAEDEMTKTLSNHAKFTVE